MSNGVFNLTVEGTDLPPSGTLEEESTVGFTIDPPPPTGFTGWYNTESIFTADFNAILKNKFIFQPWGSGSTQWKIFVTEGYWGGQWLLRKSASLPSWS